MSVTCRTCWDTTGTCSCNAPAFTDPAQPDPLTVTGRLRWEHNKLYIGIVHIGSIHQFGRNTPHTISYISQTLSGKSYTTEAEARAALVQAVKEAIGG